MSGVSRSRTRANGDRTAPDTRTLSSTVSRNPVEHPPFVELAIAGHRVVFVRETFDTYAAQVDGIRRPIQLTTHTGTSSESGSSTTDPATHERGDHVNLDALLRCLALEAKPMPIDRGIELAACDNWGHFRQNTFYKVTVRLTANAVDIIAASSTQDESYY